MLMKKFLALLMMLMLTCSSALAAPDFTNCAIANGNVAAAAFVDVTAPYSGTLSSFDLNTGDTVKAGDELFRMLTTTVYAPEDGTAKLVFAKPGDDASAVLTRYGSLVSLELPQTLRISATTSGAYNKAENRTIVLGETLYFRSTKEGKEEGEGRVILVQGDSYVVEITEGEFELGENLTLYRDDDYSNKDCVGKGQVTRRDPVTIQGMGRVHEVLVAEGEQVKASQPLLTLMAADADVDASPIVTAPKDGVVANVSVIPGQQVWKGMTLARIYLTDAIEVVADVDEMDLGNLRVGDSLSVVLDTDPDTVITGQVTEISGLGVTRQNAAYYTVHISIPSGRAALGASVSVYIPR